MHPPGPGECVDQAHGSFRAQSTARGRGTRRRAGPAARGELSFRRRARRRRRVLDREEGRAPLGLSQAPRGRRAHAPARLRARVVLLRQDHVRPPVPPPPPLLPPAPPPPPPLPDLPPGPRLPH